MCSSTGVFELKQIGIVRSTLTELRLAPKQGDEGAPAAWIELSSAVQGGLDGIEVGDELIIVTWFHKARRDVLRVHPRDDEARPLAGVFATRSSERPNPLGLHRVTVLALRGRELEVEPLEAVDGTPIVDIKPILKGSAER